MKVHKVLIPVGILWILSTLLVIAVGANALSNKKPAARGAVAFIGNQSVVTEGNPSESDTREIAEHLNDPTPVTREEESEFEPLVTAFGKAAHAKDFEKFLTLQRSIRVCI
jgi:hypothetical protein